MILTKLLWLLIGWFSFNSNMARMKNMPPIGEGRKAMQIKTQVEVHAAPVQPPAPAEPPVPKEEAPPMPAEIERRRVQGEKL